MNGRILSAVTAVAIALAGPFSTFGQVIQVRTSVTFTLSGCTALPAGLTVKGSGEAFIITNTRVDSSGFTHIETNNVTTGTATDSNGATYNFNYHNHASFDIPPGGFPFTAETTDHFNLVGNGQANLVQVHFVARLTVTSPTTITADFINIHGSPFTCDPI
jgi:hypothetical protein